MKRILFMASLLTSVATQAAGITSITDTSYTHSYATVNGLKMYYEIHGKGTGIPLVLLHGGGSTIGTTFGRVLPLLAAHRKVIALELQGNGHTADRDAPFTFEQDADDVAALLQQLGIAQADLFGFSNGGNAAIQVAIRHPQLVHKLVAGSVFYKKEGWIPGLETMFRQASADNMPPVLRKAYESASPHPQVNTLVAKLMGRLLQFRDWKEDTLRHINIPVLILAGNQDVAAIEHTVALYKLFPKGQLAIFPGGHGGYIGEATAIVKDSHMPERTVALIEEFLDPDNSK
jgi:pimeloyl-ACP methyl ester carboxylesterase